MGLKELVEISRRYGADGDFVLAGGGNTSFKDERYLYIKASGTTLAELTEGSLVRMERSRLDAIWQKRYSEDTNEREQQALADLMAARASGETSRPSVETLLHELLPERYVVHLHPALVNGLTCGGEGETVARELFGEEMLWIPVVNPGYVLASHIREAIEARRKRGGEAPALLFLENHGVFVASDEIAAIDRRYEEIVERLTSRLKRSPELSERAASPRLERLGRTLAEVLGGEGRPAEWRAIVNPEVERLLASRSSFAPIESFGYTPDHLVYCKAAPVWLSGESDAARIGGEVEAFRERYGAAPRLFALEGEGMVAVGESPTVADNARLLFLDLVKILTYAESFGGPKPMPPDKIAFILNWEVESYRAKVSGSGA